LKTAVTANNLNLLQNIDDNRKLQNLKSGARKAMRLFGFFVRPLYIGHLFDRIVKILGVFCFLLS
jgi:hypothetical protein